MKILGIEGSPRNNGNTEKLVRTILDAAAESGADTRFFKLGKMNISPCLGCIGCRKDGKCVIDDDMQTVYEEMQTCDAIVLGSPVYMWQVTAQVKSFLDRLVPFLKPDFTTRLGTKTIVPVFTQGNPDKNAFKVYFDYLENLFSFLHFNVKSTLVATATRNKDDILLQTNLLEKAQAIGQALAG